MDQLDLLAAKQQLYVVLNILHIYSNLTQG